MNFKPTTIQKSLLILAGLALFMILAWQWLEPRIKAEEAAQQACAPETLEMRCYTFSGENCRSVWAHFERECKQDVKQELLAQGSTRLTGPIVKKCIYKRMDLSFHNTRRTPIDPDCEQHFKLLDAPSLD